MSEPPTSDLATRCSGLSRRERIPARNWSAPTAHTKAYGEKVQKLRRNVEHHVGEEEGELFLKGRQTLTKTRLYELGAELQAAKGSAPTRPHPNQPPTIEISGKALGALDNVRDRVSGR